ncbi:MAG: hypothetical protein IT520_15000 [Burkholderiales bacterium]|nr:hypothetical protein [Burkholderiales bacterium]
MDPTAAGIAADFLNRALDGEDWARDRLAAHAGARLALSSGPLSARFEIGPDGRLLPAPHDAAPTLTLTIAPLDLPRLAAEPARWRERVRADGDAGLARTFEDLATTLPWFVERALARALGPVVGQQVADIGRALLAWPGNASRELAGHFARYAGEESDLVVRRSEVERSAEELAGLEARVDPLIRRVDALERSNATKQSHS